MTINELTTCLSDITPNMAVERSKLFLSYGAYREKVVRVRLPLGPNDPTKGQPILRIETSKDGLLKGVTRTSFRLVNEKEEGPFIVTTYGVLGSNFAKHVRSTKTYARITNQVLIAEHEKAIRDNLYFVLEELTSQLLAEGKDKKAHA